MAHPLDGFRLKLDRAEKHLNALERLVMAYLMRKPFDFSKERNADYTEHGFRLRVVKPIPVSISVVLGDTLQNARTALDHLAWQLAIANGRAKPHRQTGFPICGDPKQWTTEPIARQVRDMGVDAAAMIERLQPYNGGDLHRNELWVLNELARIDRHQTLHVAAAAWRGSHFVPGKRDAEGRFVPGYVWPGGRLKFAFTPGTFDDSALVVRWIVPFSDPDMEVQGRFVAGVGLRSPVAPDLPIPGTPAAIIRYIRGTVLPAFKPFFD